MEIILYPAGTATGAGEAAGAGETVDGEVTGCELGVEAGAVGAVEEVVAADGLADVVDVPVVLPQPASTIVAITTMLSSTKTFWRLRPAGRVLFLNNLIRFLPINDLPPYIFTF